MDVFESPAQVLQQLSEKLPQLDHLDLSNTNLPGIVNGTCEQSALPGWPSDRKLSFLGLWGCPFSASRRENLPAYRIAGDANEAQLIAALEAYADWRIATRRILDSLYNLINDMDATLRAPGHLFELLLERMHRYLSDERVQILAAASLIHLIRIIGMENISPMRIRTLVQRLVDTLERYTQDLAATFSYTRIANNCLVILGEVDTYEQIRVSPCDRLYERLLTVLLRIAQCPSASLANFTNLNVKSLDLLQHILCGRVPKAKLLFGEVGGVRVVLSILKQLLSDQNADHREGNAQNVQTCWKLLCAVTNEAAPNCRRFIDLSGRELFIRCMYKWPECKSLEKNMLIVLANVAEVKDLRGYLKDNWLIAIFLEKLDEASEANDISYVTACVLSLMLADGEDLWRHKAGCHDKPLPPVALAYSHAAISERVVAAIDRWDPMTDFKLIYTTLLPILSTITSSYSFASLYWAAWLLNNLTLVKPDKYCSLLLRENALDILDAAIADARSPDKVRCCLMITVARMRKHIKEQSSAGVRSGVVSQSLS